MRVEAKTLEEAYKKAADILNCSVSDLKVEVIQYPTKGLFGLFSKNAIIEVEEEIDIKKAVEKIKEELTNLFAKSCYNVEIKEVLPLNDESIFIHIDGEDAPLLIGKEGFRYNALNYMLYNYIHQKYGFKVKLEIAKFIETQKERLGEYLDFFIKEKIQKQGYGKTKPLDGILAFLALEILREKLPDKYVAIKERNGEKFVIVGDRYGNNSSDSNS